MARASRRIVITWAAATVAAMLATGGIALASGASPNPSIHACVNNGTGVLRIARHCRLDEHAVMWNQHGPAGPQGSMGIPGLHGPAGPAGSTGPTGPSDGWAVNNAVPTIIQVLPTSLITAPTLPGAVGGTSYLVSATVSLVVPLVDTTAASVTCTLSLGTATYQTVSQMFDPGAAASATLAVGATITAPAAPSLTCHLNGGSDAMITGQVELTAVRVGTLH